MAHQLLLKAIKYSEWASQETACYQAKLYVDGKSFAYVSNEGHGGPDRVDRDPKYKGNWSEVMREVTEGFNDENVFLEKHHANSFQRDGVRIWRHGAVNVWTSTLLARI